MARLDLQVTLSVKVEPPPVDEEGNESANLLARSLALVKDLDPLKEGMSAVVRGP